MPLRSELQEAQAALKNELSNSEVKDERIREFENTLEELSTRAEQQQQTISFLVSEKASLTASLERFEDAEASESTACRCQGGMLTIFRVARDVRTLPRGT